MPKETAPNVSPNWGVFASLGSASCWSKWVTIYTIYIYTLYMYFYYVDTIYIYIWTFIDAIYTLTYIYIYMYVYMSFQVPSGPFRSFPQMGGPYERPSFWGPLRITVYIHIYMYIYTRFTCMYVYIYIYTYIYSISMYIYIHNIHIDNMCTYIHYLHIVYIYISHVIPILLASFQQDYPSSID